MLYRHTLQFQRVLYHALLNADNIDDAWLKKNAQLSVSPATIGRFRSPDNLLSQNKETIDLNIHNERDKDSKEKGLTLLNSRDSFKLWDYLYHRKYIERAMRSLNIKKSGLYTLPELANTITSYYETHPEQISDFKTSGLPGVYFCYKPSNIKENSVVKSRFEIVDCGNEYFEVIETQRAIRDGTRRRAKEELSSGFAFSKSKTLWIFMKEIRTGQPRVFCFDPDDADVDQLDFTTTRQDYSVLLGHILEGGGQFSQVRGTHAFRVGLASVESDRQLWESNHDGTPYVEEDQVNIFPVLEADQQKLKKPVSLDTEILRYIWQPAWGEPPAEE